MAEKHYAERDIFELGEHYVRHVRAMTAEGLHEKSDIAAELAFRDARIAELKKELKITDENRNKASLRLSQMQLDMEDLRTAIESLAREWDRRESSYHVSNPAAHELHDCAAELRALLEGGK